ncbi:hypothetical protein H696_00105 [Fonticula alba]|uniref:FHA domain-containing protein n=1 Tax=Fonticula alba TaxID=691883 RepID=A0A058ZEZ4_FONAL|nr:hypothetical protein H696_00105 [Fonticula alba]KCV72511.1 hypothetical protein H696_00105 [Fonticula alba]|eukprot:XP_009492212.1 hypothetical protein H696_00105 [Fonticula alba]
MWFLLPDRECPLAGLSTGLIQPVPGRDDARGLLIDGTRDLVLGRAHIDSDALSDGTLQGLLQNVSRSQVAIALATDGSGMTVRQLGRNAALLRRADWTCELLNLGETSLLRDGDTLCLIASKPTEGHFLFRAARIPTGGLLSDTAERASPAPVASVDTSIDPPTLTTTSEPSTSATSSLAAAAAPMPRGDFPNPMPDPSAWWQHVAAGDFPSRATAQHALRLAPTSWWERITWHGLPGDAREVHIVTPPVGLAHGGFSVVSSARALATAITALPPTSVPTAIMFHIFLSPGLDAAGTSLDAAECTRLMECCQGEQLGSSCVLSRAFLCHLAVALASRLDDSTGSSRPRIGISFSTSPDSPRPIRGAGSSGTRDLNIAQYALRVRALLALRDNAQSSRHGTPVFLAAEATWLMASVCPSITRRAPGAVQRAQQALAARLPEAAAPDDVPPVVTVALSPHERLASLGGLSHLLLIIAPNRSNASTWPHCAGLPEGSVSHSASAHGSAEEAAHKRLRDCYTGIITESVTCTTE